MGLFLWESMVAFPGLWAVVGPGFRLTVPCMWGLVFVCLFPCPMCGRGLFGQIACWYWLVFVSG